MKKEPKEYYRTYLADDSLMDLNLDLIEAIMKVVPYHALEFGCGTGKNIAQLEKRGVPCMGIDVSPMNVIHGMVKNNVRFIGLGDEGNLRHLCNLDVVFTCSVMDHVKDKDFKAIIGEFKRIANKAVFLAETNDKPGDYYYSHDYEAEGFVKFGKEYKSLDGDGAMYYIWAWFKT